MKKILYSQFDTIGSVLDNVIKNSDLQAGLKKTTLCKFWSKIVGKKFENLSRPHSLNKNGTLTIACANSYVTSELVMFKTDLIKKLEPYAKSLDFEITDLNFSHKIWQNEKSQEDIEQEEASHNQQKPKVEINYDEIELNEEEVESIRKCVENNKFASEEQRKRMFDAIVKDLKYQKFFSSI